MSTLSRSILTAILFVAASGSDLDAQQRNRGIIRGTIVDAGDESVPGSAVAVWNAADSTLVTGVISKPDGSFVVESLPDGSFYVVISALGFEPMVRSGIELGSGTSTIDLGRLALTVDSDFDSEEVTIAEDRPDVELRSDRTVFNVENQPATAGGNVIDILKNIPQVEVDLNDRVSLRGSQNVAVHINDRPVPLSGEALSAYLKGLPADMIASVEVVPNPSAKYDPDGMAGIINIVFKKKQPAGGVSGSLAVSGSTNNSYDATGSLNYAAGRFGLFSSYSFQYEERWSDATQYLQNHLTDPDTELDLNTTSKGITRGHVLNATLDYQLDEASRHALTLTTLGTIRNGQITENNDYFYRDNEAAFRQSSLRRSYGTDDWLDADVALAYRYTLVPGRHELTAEARYTSNDVETGRDYHERPANADGTPQDSIFGRQANDIGTYNRGVVGQLDYVRPIGEKGRLEAGYKSELSTIENSFYSESFDPSAGEYNPDLNLNNEFIYDVDIHSIYTTYGHTFGPVDAQIGLRAEQALTNFRLVTTDVDYENNYFSLFPSASALWTVNDALRLQGSYSKRINRPRTWALNPFGGFEDRLNLQRGNPYLQPEYVHSFEMNLGWYKQWGSLSISPYYRRKTDLIERWMTIDTNGVTTTRFENFESTDLFGSEITGTYRIRDRFSGYVNLSIYQFDLDGSNVESELANKSLGMSVHGSGTVTVLKGLDVQGTFYYRAPMNIVRGGLTPQYQAGLAVRKSLFDDRASLSLNVNDIFGTMGFGFHRDDPRYYTEVDWRWASQHARLAFSWNFGQRTQGPQRRRRQSGDGETGAPGGVGI